MSNTSCHKKGFTLRKSEGFATVPLIVVVFVVALIPLVAYFITVNKVGVAPKAAYPTCNKYSCAYASQCILSGKKITVSGITYTCRGGNRWADPQGVIKQGDGNGPAAALAVQPTTAALPTSMPVEPTLSTDQLSGCVITLRFDRDDAPDPALKSQAQSKMSQIATEIKSGKKPLEVLSQLLPDPALEAVKQVWARRSGITPQVFPTIHPYENFQTNDAPNFCWANSTERHELLGGPFYETNPQFQIVLQSLGTGQVSEPFIVHRITPSKIIEYAVMLVTR